MTFNDYVLRIMIAFWSIASAEILKLHQQNIAIVNESYQQSSVEFSGNTYRYVMIQASSQTNNISISYKQALEYGEHKNSTSVGLIYLLEDAQERIDTYLAAPLIPTKAQVLAIPYFVKDPLPGGCCITCSFDNDPNIVMIKESLIVKLLFERANMNYKSGSIPASCDGGNFDSFKLTYDLYMYQLESNEFSEEKLFEAMWKMSSPANIKYFGSKIGSIEHSRKPLFLLQAIPYRGVVYNIIVWNNGHKSEAAYNPNFVYGCNIKEKESCKRIGSWITICSSIIAGIVGLALCFLGHKFIKTELFISGFLSSFLIACILLIRFSSVTYTVCMLISTCIGTVFGILLIISWVRTRFTSLCFLISSALIGWLTACIILFSPIGQNEVFASNLVYLLTVLCITFVFPVPLAFFPKASSIIFSSLYGGFAVVACCSVFTHAHIHYIIIQFILRAGVPSFADAYLRIPLQRTGYILSGIWITLLISGSICQYYLTRNEKFPPPRLQSRKNGRKNQKGSKRTRDETTPLLQNDDTQYGGTAEYKFESINSY